MTNPLVDHEIEITPAQAEQALEAGTATVIDVREPYEWEAGRIDGVRHIELERLAAEAETIDRARPVIFQCRLGVRSLMAAQAFRRAGFEAWSMAGGIQRWADEGRPLVPDHAQIAEH
ncbi:MAG TPA: rhodanese-like domain-containing protein [Solirubrobacteraceae bacterium]|nr:rhodanese-like domain-containing protein [Solirubrobacteraceae bacterium]